MRERAFRFGPGSNLVVLLVAGLVVVLVGTAVLGLQVLGGARPSTLPIGYVVVLVVAAAAGYLSLFERVVVTGTAVTAWGRLRRRTVPRDRVREIDLETAGRTHRVVAVLDGAGRRVLVRTGLPQQTTRLLQALREHGYPLSAAARTGADQAPEVPVHVTLDPGPALLLRQLLLAAWGIATGGLLGWTAVALIARALGGS